MRVAALLERLPRVRSKAGRVNGECGAKMAKFFSYLPRMARPTLQMHGLPAKALLKACEFSPEKMSKCPGNGAGFFMKNLKICRGQFGNPARCRVARAQSATQDSSAGNARQSRLYLALRPSCAGRCAGSVRVGAGAPTRSRALALTALVLENVCFLPDFFGIGTARCIRRQDTCIGCCRQVSRDAGAF